MINKIIRNYLEIKSPKELNEIINNDKNFLIRKLESNDFQLNKFFYKQIGKKYHWTDRLQWSDQKWINYVSYKKLYTFILQHNEDLVGYFELIHHDDKNEIEIAYFGILEEYYGKKIGGFLLSEAIKESFLFKVNRVWLHTCTLDHKNALQNYISRGMKVFKVSNLLI